jgi:hypothetical protein
MRMRNGPPFINFQSSGLTEAARTFIKTSLSLGTGFSKSLIWITSGGPIWYRRRLSWADVQVYDVTVAFEFIVPRLRGIQRLRKSCRSTGQWQQGAYNAATDHMLFRCGQDALVEVREHLRPGFLVPILRFLIRKARMRETDQSATRLRVSSTVTTARHPWLRR